MKLKTAAVMALLCATPAVSQTLEESVVQQLQAQGFTSIRMERTFLGRLRFEAYSDTLERELVINPNTGQVLRDVWEPIDDDDDDELQIADPRFDEDDEDFEGDFEEDEEDDDEDEDDDDDDDNDDEDEEDDDEDDDDD